MVVVSGTDSGFDPAVFFIQSDRREVGLRNLKKNGAFSLSGQGGQQGGSGSSPSPGGVHGDVQNLGFIRTGLSPGTETRRIGVDRCEEQREVGIVAQRPLRRFGTPLLNAGDRGKIALRCGSNHDGIVRAAQTSIVTGMRWSWRIALALGCAGVLGATWAEAQSAQRKFNAIRDGRIPAGSSVLITAAELNSWVGAEAKTYFPEGLRNPRLEFGDGEVTGYALIDFLKLRQAATGEAPGWVAKNLFAGERPVTIVVRIESSDGRARVDVESVAISGIQIEGRVLDFLIQNYLIPEFPKAKVNQWFDLAFRIDHIAIGPRGASVSRAGGFRASRERLDHAAAADRHARADERLEKVVQHGVADLLGHGLFAGKAEGGGEFL
jgi:hypothetical protein